MQTPARDPAARGAGPSGALLAVGVIVLLGTVVPLVVAAHYDALGIPRGDDWSYLVTEFRWLDSGRLSFNHWVSMTLVGQLLLAAPVSLLWPRDITALQVFTAVVGTIGLLAVWRGACLAGIGAARAALLAVTIAVGPLWAALAASFMTDVPAFAASAVALALTIRAVTRPTASLGWLAGAVAAAVVAVTIRQYAVVTLAAVLVTAWIAVGPDRRARRAVAAMAVVAVVVVVAVLLWWRTIPDGRALSPGLPDAHAIGVLVSKGAGFVRLAGLLLLPVLVAGRPVRRMRAAWHDEPVLTGAVAALGAVGLAVTAGRVVADVFVGNYLVHDGVLSDIVVIGPRPDVLPGAVWAAVVVGASIAGIVLAVLGAHALGTTVRRAIAGPRAPVDPVTVLLGTTVVGYLAAFGLAMLTGIQVYDRYLLPVLPAAGMLLLRAPAAAPAVDVPERPRTGTTVAVVGATVVLAAIGFAFATDSASFDGARWRAAEAAVARGWPATRVNGGFEWLNYHRGDKLPPRRADRQTLCVTVHVDPRVAPERVVAVVRSAAPTRRDARLVAYRTPAPCPEPRAP